MQYSASAISYTQVIFPENMHGVVFHSITFVDTILIFFDKMSNKIKRKVIRSTNWAVIEDAIYKNSSCRFF
jgi:hypothetical protein